MLTNNDIKDITKVIRSVENGGILLKGTIEKAINQKGRILSNVRGPLMRADLSLMKNVLTPLANIVLTPLGSTAAA